MLKFKIPQSMGATFAASLISAGIYTVLSWLEDDLFSGSQIAGFISVPTNEQGEAFKKEYNKFLTAQN